MTSNANAKNVIANVKVRTNYHTATICTGARQQQVATQNDVGEGLEEFHTCNYPVKNVFHGYIIGKRGHTINELRKMTGAQIVLLGHKDTVVIKGSLKAIDEAKHALDDLVKKAYNGFRPTHFLSLPICSPSIDDKVQTFQRSILSCEGVDPSILVSPLNLHITIGVLKLLEPCDVEDAVDFLKAECPKVVNSVLKNMPLSIDVQHLSVMQSDPAAAHVLYVKAENKTLNTLCTAVINKMIEGGFMQKDKRSLKIHITMINTAYREPKPKHRFPFNASSILEEYGELELGRVRLDSLHLMKMGRTGPGKTYVSVGSIPLPSEAVS
ncbi:activating signal cointegrator 1 complex subunit [Apophysomyces sp. BC1015]|nr:activating signal cointegrator 1 complex subunit [Apophysomyces sp. BC1015]